MLGESDGSQNHVKFRNSKSIVKRPPESKLCAFQGGPKGPKGKTTKTTKTTDLL